MPVDPDKVAIYIRWSTDDQGQGTTLQTQLERCRHYLASQGWQFRDDLVYIDDGFSGGTLHRPALTRLRADVDAGRVECVVVYKIDRLSRSVVDIVDLVLREWEGRCFVKSTTEDVNTVTPAGKMFFYMLISFAEYERSLIRERTLGGKRKRAEQGLNPGFRPPFGYTRGAGPGTLRVVPDEAAGVRQVFARYLQGEGAAQIAARLGAAGALRRGRAWTTLAVRRTLANPLYAGILRYGTLETPNAVPPLVEPSVWAEVQALLGARGRKTGGRRPTYSSYLLSGLARCQCGAPVQGKRAGRHAYYVCTARKREGRTACAAPHLPVARVEAVVADQVRQRLADFPSGRLATALRTHLAGVKAALVNGRKAQDRRRVAELLIERERVSALLKAPEHLNLSLVWDALAQTERKQLVSQMARAVTLGGPGTVTVEWQQEPAGAGWLQSLVSQGAAVALSDPPS
jgi:site-specific DNA recombinase